MNQIHIKILKQLEYSELFFILGYKTCPLLMFYGTLDLWKIVIRKKLKLG